jgi:hypothetical protein
MRACADIYYGMSDRSCLINPSSFPFSMLSYECFCCSASHFDVVALKELGLGTWRGQHSAGTLLVLLE